MNWRWRRILWIFDFGFKDRRGGPGWVPPMGTFMMLIGAGFVAIQFGQALADILLAIFSVVDLFVTSHFVRRYISRLKALGLRGPSLPRWWIEAAALNWTLVAGSAMFAIAHRNAGGGWMKPLLEFANRLLPVWYDGFLVFAVTGFLLGILRNRPVNGPASELVSAFFWGILLILFSIHVVPDAPALSNLIAPALAIVGVGLLVTIGVLQLRNWYVGIRVNDQQAQ